MPEYRAEYRHRTMRARSIRRAKARGELARVALQSPSEARVGTRDRKATVQAGPRLLACESPALAHLMEDVLQAHWVQPHHRRDGSYVPGHWHSTVDR